jgi:hypothetical protein
VKPTEKAAEKPSGTSTSKPAEQLAEKPAETIATLIEERHRYEKWLTALDTRLATTPPPVYARVRADYEERLSGVLERLGSRSVELREGIDTLAEAVAALQANVDGKRDERAEAEVRAAVGEFTPEEWDEMSRGADTEIARIEGQRGEMAAELTRMQELLAAASAPPPAPPPRVMPTPRPAPPAPPAIARSTPRSTPAVSPSLSGAVPTPAGGAPAHAGMLDTLGASPHPGQPRHAATSGGGGAPAITAPTGVPVYLRDAPSQQAKTLKCAECGTLNFPTEWYCERCGGELAAL